MTKLRKRKPTVGGYQYVTDLKRKQLIELIYSDDGITLKQAAKQLEIKYSTAKTIKRVFEIEKRVTKLPNPRRSKVKRRQLLMNRQKIFAVAHVNKMIAKGKSLKKFKRPGFKLKKLDTKIKKPFENTPELQQIPEIPEKQPEVRTDQLCQLLELWDQKRRLQADINRNKFHLETISIYSKFYDPSFEMREEREAIARETENLISNLAFLEKKQMLLSN